MNYIKYDEETLKSMQKIFEENNNNISYSLDKINEELSNMSVVLSTPKSNKGLTKVADIIKEDRELVSEEGGKMINRFNQVKEIYENYIKEIKETVGDINE